MVVARNRVTFSDEVNVSGAYIAVIGGEGRYWSGVKDNTVTFDSSGNIEVMLATGGRSHGLVQNNHVEMKKGENTIEYIRGGWSEQMDTVGNTVEITGGHLKVKEIIGGFAEQGSAIGNIISLGNATIESTDKYYPLTIAAGYAYGRYHGKAEDNKIILKSSLDLSGASLEGWGNLSSVELSSHKGNELILESTGNTVMGIKNFDDITFMKLDPREAAITIADGGIIDLDETVQSAPATLMSISDESMDSETWNVNLHLPSLDRMAEGVKMGEAAILIDASKASSVKGLDALAASFESSTQTLSYKEGEIRVTGTAGTDVTENKLTYGLKTIDEITYGHLDWKENDTVITLDESRNFDLSDTKVKLGNLEFKAGSLKGIDKKGAHQMTLLDTAGNTTLKEENIEGNKESSWTLGNALAGKGSASLEENGNLIYTIHASEDSIKATEETHHILMGREGDMGLLSAGKDRIMNVFSSMKSEEGEPMIFASVGYGYDRYDTGSHIKSHNWTGLAGVGQEKTIRKGTLSYGLFYERGDGSYKTYNADFTGKGDNDYNGGGLLLHYMMDNRTYVEGSLRMGHMDSHGDNMLRDAEGKPLSYDSDSNYWGTHIGIGHVFDLTDEKEALPAGVERAAKDIDVYGKYFHTHLGGDTVTVNGIAYNLDAIDSDLLRIGTRFNYRQGRNTFYAGIAWDYEMSGKGTGTVSASGMSAPIRSTDTKGGSFMAEAGWKLERAHDNPWTMDVNLAAYGGQHRGIYGNVSVGYRF